MTQDNPTAPNSTSAEAVPEEAKAPWEQLNLTTDKRIDLALTLVFIVMGVFMIVVARGFRLGSQPDFFTARGFPYLAGILLIIEGIALAAWRLRSWSELPGNMIPEEGQEDEKGYPASWKPCIGCIFLSFAWDWLLEPLGILIVTPLYLFACAVVMGERKWLQMTLFSIVFTLANWLFFGPLLKVRFPLGPLESLVYAIGLGY